MLQLIKRFVLFGVIAAILWLALTIGIAIVFNYVYCRFVESLYFYGIGNWMGIGMLVSNYVAPLLAILVTRKIENSLFRKTKAKRKQKN